MPTCSALDGAPAPCYPQNVELVPPGLSGEALFEEELVVPEQISERGASTDIKVMLTKRNRVVVQRPTVAPLALDFGVPTDVPWPDASFVAVSMTVGCLPDPDCYFTWLRVEVDLGADEPDGEDRPIAYLLFPEDGEDELESASGVELTGELKVEAGGLGGPSLGFVRKRSTSGSLFRYRVVTFGQRGPNAAWDFRATEVHPEIAGDVSLHLVVAMQPSRTSSAAVDLSARAQLRRGGGAIPLITRRSARDVRAHTFELSS